MSITLPSDADRVDVREHSEDVEQPQTHDKNRNHVDERLHPRDHRNLRVDQSQKHPNDSQNDNQTDQAHVILQSGMRTSGERPPKRLAA